MTKKLEQVYQFKITLLGIEPPIWRRIQVPETYSFGALHVAIQDAMGWHDCHLHEFVMNDPADKEMTFIGVFEADMEGETMPEWKTEIAKFFSQENSEAEYTYDMGDSWSHIVELEEILPKKARAKYPALLGGARACPPEDCGGIWGYQDLLEIFKDPKHERYKEMVDWLGGKIDAERFDARKVRFDDPEKRKLLMGGMF